MWGFLVWGLIVLMALCYIVVVNVSGGLRCAVLCCVVLCCVVLYCIVLSCVKLSCVEFTYRGRRPYKMSNFPFMNFFLDL